MPTISLASKTDSTVGQNESDLVDAGSLLRLSWHQNRVRVKSDFGRRINVIGLSSPSAKNILLPFFRNECFARRSHPQEEGRLAIVTNVGGMRWTRQRRARGRIARRFRERSERARRTALKRTAKACGPGTRLLVSSRRRSYDAQPGASGHPFAGDGGKTNSSPGRVRHKPFQPLRGDAGCFRCLRCEYGVHTSLPPARTRLRVHWPPGIPRALFNEGGEISGKARASHAATMRMYVSLCLTIETVLRAMSCRG